MVITGAGANFCSGGDVHEIIGPLTAMAMPELLAFTRMTGDVVKAMRACPQPVIAAVDGVCAGAGAMLALAADLRYGTPSARVAFLFTRVGLAGADMGACTLLPRVVGQGRASELLFSGRSLRPTKRWHGDSSTGCARPMRCSARRRRSRGRSPRADVRPRDDEEDAAPGMGDGARRGDRG